VKLYVPGDTSDNEVCFYETKHTEPCPDKDCDGECPKCGSCLHGNSACGDPECCGPYIARCTNDDCDYDRSDTDDL